MQKNKCLVMFLVYYVVVAADKDHLLGQLFPQTKTDI